MPKPEVIKKALDEIAKRAINYEYFFDRLKSPDWIEPLYKEGMFQYPPPPKRDGDYISYPFWPESRYLVRMASLSPELVLEIALKIPDTENFRIHEDFADAACAMPPKLAALWVKKEIDWIKSQKYLHILLPEKYGKLVSHLSIGGQVEEALKLAHAILAVLPDPMAAIKSAKDETYIDIEPRISFDIWNYEQFFNKHMPDLITTTEKDALRLVCDLLVDAIRFSQQHKEDEQTNDYSYIWRPAIEDHSQNHSSHGLRDILIVAVRDTAETLMKTNGKDVLEIVEKRPFKIFKRIGLHLRRKWPKVDPEGTACLIINPNVFNDTHLHYEFFHLLSEQFNTFPQKTQKSYLSLIAKGLDAEKWIDFQERKYGHVPGQQEVKRYIRHWKYTKLWPIQDFLDRDWREQFDAFKDEFGELDHPDFYSYMSTSWAGPTSPKKGEDIKSMKIDELVSFLDSWKPSKDLMSPSPEVLGRELTTIVSAEPERFAIEANRFKALDPTYVRGLLSGFREAINQKKSFQWPSILDLCRWVIDQPREIQQQEDEDIDRDIGWGWTRKAIASLFSAAFNSDAPHIPFNLRSTVWEVLKPITDDPDPTPDHEALYGGSNMNPATLSINTTRGEAMHAVMRYALWVRRNIEAEPDGKERSLLGFEEMPEVREVLNNHLEPSYDPALATRAVYGQWFPWLVKLDQRWAAQKVAKIFPSNENFKNLHDAAWETYITLCNPYDNVLDLLQDEYSYAIDKIGTFSSDRQLLYNPDERLAIHLMTYYWRGKLDLNDPDGLLARFYAKAPEKLLGHSIEFIGRSLHETKGAIESEILGRLKQLWEKRMITVQSETPPIVNTELSNFGWWLASTKFDDSWAISQLKNILELTGDVEPDFLVVERLGELSAVMPLLVVECLGLIVKNNKEEWRIYSLAEHVRIILSTALRSSDGKARQVAEDIVHRLGARGYLAFRDLLSMQGSN